MRRHPNMHITRNDLSLGDGIVISVAALFGLVAALLLVAWISQVAHIR